MRHLKYSLLGGVVGSVLFVAQALAVCCPADDNGNITPAGTPIYMSGPNWVANGRAECARYISRSGGKFVGAVKAAWHRLPLKDACPGLPLNMEKVKY